MGDTPTPVNKPATVVNTILQGLIYDIGVKMALAEIIVQVPFLGWPIIRSIVNLALNKLATYLFNALSTFMTFTIIDFQTDHEKAVYEAAVNEFKMAHDTGDPVKIEKAKQDFKSSLGKLIHWDGST